MLGTKAQFIKTIPVINESIARGYEVSLYDLNQHAKTSKQLLKKIDSGYSYVSLTKNQEDLGTYSDLIKWFFYIVFNFLIIKKLKFKNEVCIVHGDTLSTILGAFITRKGSGTLVLLEAGHPVPGVLDHFPESIIRYITAKISKILIANGQDQVKQLKKWKVKGKIIEISTNSILDSFKKVTLYDHKASNKVTVAVHRNENLNNRKRMELLVKTIINASADYDITWYLHIPTRNKLKKYKLIDKLTNANVNLKELIEYDKFINELHNSVFVITDGGSLVEECQMLGVPTLVWRNEHLDQNHLFEKGKNLYLSNYNQNDIKFFLSNYINIDRNVDIDLNTSPSKEIINELNEWMSYKIIYVLGTKAQFIKCKHILENLISRNIKIIIIDTGQHKEFTTNELGESGLIYEYINISKNKVNVSSIYAMVVWFLKIVFSLKNKHSLGNVSFCMVHGDTVSTLVGLLYAKYNGYKTVHLESGYKSFNLFKPFPEEIIRNIVTKYSDFLIVDGKTQLNNVAKYKEKKKIIEIPRNTIIDSLNEFNFKNPTDVKNNLIVTVHRTENIYYKKKMLLLIELLKEIQIKYSFDNINWFCHDVTLNAIRKFKLEELIKNNNIELKNLITHDSFISELRSSKLIITDGGSIAEECSILGLNTIIWRDVVENEEYLNEHVILSKYNFETIFKFLNVMKNRRNNFKKFNSPSEELVKQLVEYL